MLIAEHFLTDAESLRDGRSCHIRIQNGSVFFRTLYPDRQHGSDQ